MELNLDIQKIYEKLNLRSVIKMTPDLLFKYIIAVICGITVSISVSAIIVTFMLYLWFMCFGD